MAEEGEDDFEVPEEEEDEDAGFFDGADGVEEEVEEEAIAAVGDEPPEKRPRVAQGDAAMSGVDWSLLDSFRKSALEGGEVPALLRMQVVDIEHQKRWLPSDELDDREARQAREDKREYRPTNDDDDCETSKRPRQSSRQLVPCVRIYGRLEDGRSACANVYGYYPVVHLLPACRLDNPAIVEDLVEGVNKELLEAEKKGKYGANKKHPQGWTPIICARVVSGFVAFPYSERPDSFLELKLADASYVKMFGRAMRQNDGQLETRMLGPVAVMPYSCQDVVDKFQADTGISGFGWIEIANPSETDRDGNYGDHSRCDLEVDCSISTGIRPVKDGAVADKIAPLRMITYDIECAKTRGMPTPERDPVIVIAAICAEYEGGQPVPEKTRRVVLQLGTADRIKGLDPQKGDVHMCFGEVGGKPPVVVQRPYRPGDWSSPKGAGTVQQEQLEAAERDLLDAFGRLVRNFDPDYMCGHNMIGFDQPYVVTRAHAIDAFEAEELGRRGSFKWQKPRRVVKKRKNGETRETTVTATPGRIQLDTLTWIMNGFVKERSYRLGSLAAKYLGDTKDDVGYSMIVPLWKRSDETRARLAKYCLKDTDLTYALCNLKQYQMVISSIEMSRQTRVPACKLLRSGVQVKVWALLLEKAKSPHFDDANTPVFFPDEEVRERAKDDKFQGAEVLEPHRGYYGESWIGCGDFRSLYPSIIIDLNICYTTELKNNRYDDVVEWRTSPVGTRFVDKKHRIGLLPQIEEELMHNRDVAKKQCGEAKKKGDEGAACMYDKRQNEIKIICNSVYGIMTASGGRLTRMEMGESVTSQGRLMIMTAKGIAEKLLVGTDQAETPFKVIYGCVL